MRIRTRTIPLDLPWIIDILLSVVALQDYLLRFRMLTNDQLVAKQAALESQETFFSQQGMGSKSMTRDLRLLQDQLNAIAFVLRERGTTTVTPIKQNPCIGHVDFSEIQ